MAKKNDLKVVLFVLGLIFSEFAFAALTVTAPDVVTGYHFDITWSGGAQYSVLYEQSGSMWNQLATSSGSAPYTYSIHYKPNGTYRYWVRSCTYPSNVCEDIYKTVVVDINSPPTISSIAAQTINEDTSTGAISFTVTDSDTSLSSLSITPSSSNQSIIPSGNITIGGSGGSRTVTVLPAANAYTSGTPVVVTLTVNDGRNNVTGSFNVTVNAVNDAPSVQSISDQVFQEDSAPTITIPITVSDAETSTASIAVNATSSNTGLIPSVSVSGTTNRTLTVTPTPDTSGVSTITVTANDGSLSYSTQFKITINGVNDAPTVTAYPVSLTIEEDKSTGAQSFAVGDIDTPLSSLVVTATSLNTAIIASVSVTGSGSYYSFNAVPAANASGSTYIRLTVSDGSLSKTADIPITVTAVNDPPTISNISAQTTNEDTASSSISFTVADIDTPVTSLKVTGSSGNTNVVANSGIQISGSGSSRSVIITPIGDANGSAVITLSVSDSVAADVSKSFTINVTAVNDMPIITAYPTLVQMVEDTPSGSKAFVVGDIDTPLSSIQVSAVSNDTSKISGVNVTGSGAYYSFVVNPVPNASGDASITLSAYDGSATKSVNIPVKIEAVNDAPVISLISDKTISEDVAGGTGAISFTVSDVETLASALEIKAVSDNQALVPDANAAIGGSGTSRTITVTPIANGNGEVNITVSASDGSNTNTRKFKVTVTAVNDAPTISPISDVNILEDQSSPDISFTVQDVDTVASSLSVIGTSNNQALILNANINCSGTSNVRICKFQPVQNASGDAVVTISVNDGIAAPVTTSFNVHVTASNDPTVIASASSSFYVFEGDSPLSIPITLSDVDSDVGLSQLIANSSNTSLVPNTITALTLSGSGSSRSLKVTPSATSGTTTIVLSATDSQGLVNTYPIQFTVMDKPAEFVNPPGENHTGIYTIAWRYGTNIRVSERLYEAPWKLISNNSEPGEGSLIVKHNSNGLYQYMLEECSSTCTAVAQLTVSVVLDPPIPPQLSAPETSNNGDYLVSWTKQTNASRYEIYENGTRISNLDIEQLSFSGVSSKSTGVYEYRARACNDVCSDLGTAKVVKVARPTTVDTLNISLDEMDGIPRLSWNGPSGSTSYLVSQAIDGVWGDPIEFSSTNISLPPVSKVGKYQYKVSSCAEAQGYKFCLSSAAYSREVILELPSLAVFTLVPSHSDSGSYSIYWGPAVKASYYKIYEGDAYTNIYQLSHSVNAKPSGSYEYRIAACNAVGCSLKSLPSIVDVAIVAAANPVAAAINAETGVPSLSWTPVQGAAFYKVQKLLNSAKVGDEESTFVPAINLQPVVAAGTYSFTVSPCLTVGSYTNCRESSISNSIPVSAPGVAVLSAPEASDTGNYDVTWTAVTDATFYRLSENGLPVYSGSALSFHVDNKSSGPWVYSVEACKPGAVCGSASDSRIVAVNNANGGSSGGTSSSNSGGNTSSGSSSSVQAFNFENDAPANFKHSFSSSGLPDLGETQSVAITKGEMSVSNGATNYRVALELPPAVRDLKPNLSLNYNSRAGNGMVGVGWSLGGISSISRCKATYATEGAQAQKSNPKYSNGDRLCLDGKKLVIASSSVPANDAIYWATGAEYKTEIDDFSRIRAYGTHNGAHVYFKVWTKDGRILTYGGETDSQNSRIYAAGQDSGPINTWALDKVEDAYSNSYTITYTRNTANGEYYPLRINFAPEAAVVFAYQTATVRSGYDAGHAFQHTKLLDTITTYIGVTDATHPENGQAVKQYDLHYKTSPTTSRSLVDEIKECGYRGSARTCAKPLSFEWEEGETGFELPETLKQCGSKLPINMESGSFAKVGDIDGDGYSDILTQSVSTRNWTVNWGTANNCFTEQALTGASGKIEFGQLIQTSTGMAFVYTEFDQQGEYVNSGIVQFDRRSAQALFTQIEFGQRFVVADFNNDGLPDILTHKDTYSSPIIYSQNVTPVGSFSRAAGLSRSGVVQYPIEKFTAQPTAIDYNQDGLPDVLENLQFPYRPIYEDRNGVQVESGHYVYDLRGETLIYSHGIVLSKTMVKRNLDGLNFEWDSASILPISTKVDPPTPNSLYPLAPMGRKQPFYVMGDFNGDGLMDYAAGASVYLGTGTGFVYSTDFSGYSDQLFVYVLDWNKDGRAEIIHPAQIDGNTQAELYDLNAGWNLMNSNRPDIFRGDLNNDGLQDVFYGTNTVQYQKSAQPDLLRKATDGFGVEAIVNYGVLSSDDNNGGRLYTAGIKPEFPQMLVNGIQVVKSLQLTNGLGSYNTRYFNYLGAKVDRQGRGFLGFDSISVVDSATGIGTETDYRQDYPYIGRVESVRVTSADGPISTIRNSYAIHSLNNRFPYLRQTSKIDNVLLSTSLSASISTNTFDKCGNLTNQTTKIGTNLDRTYSDVTGQLSQQDIVNAIDDANTDDCSDDFLESKTETVTKTSTGESKTAVTEFVPNAAREVSQQTSFKDTTVEHVITYGRASNGVINSIEETASDINSDTTTLRKVTYSNFTKGIYPQTVTHYLSSGNHIESLTYDYRFGETASITDANNQASGYEYDAFGRLVTQTSPVLNKTELSSYYCSELTAIACPATGVYAVAKRVSQATRTAGVLSTDIVAVPTEVTFYDVLQRVVRKSTYSLSDSNVNIDTAYDANGRVSMVSEPYVMLNTAAYAAASGWSEYSDYDALGRPHTITGADGGSKTISYAKDGNNLQITETVTLKDSKGNFKDTQTTTRYLNPLGQVVQVKDARNVPVDYEYDSAGNLSLTKVNNNSNTQVSIDYDIAGNKTYINDPDAGAINFEYNGFGELRRQTWRKDTADAKSITYAMDQLGRTINRTDQPVTGNSVLYSWIWDTKKKGFLSSVNGNGQEIEYYYDSHARVNRMATRVTGYPDRQFQYSYDDFGRPDTVTYPNNFRIQRTYHGTGLMVRTDDITDSANIKPLWVLGNNLDVRGNLTNQLWGNGVVTQTGFDPKSGRISSIKSGRLSTTNQPATLFGDIQALSYENDSLGNLESRTSKRTNAAGTSIENVKESFTYDRVNRLKTSITSELFARTKSYDYDDLGNLTNRTSTLGSSAANDDVGALAYDQLRNAGIHAVTSSGSGLGRVEYGYDKYGNMTQRGNETIAYDVFNKPISIIGTSNTTINYGADHERFKETTDGVTTYTYAGGLYEEVVSNGVTTQKSYVDGVVINSVVVSGGVAASNDTQYLHGDNLGSVEAITNNLGAFVTRMSFSDWGERQKTDWKTGVPDSLDFATANGYTGHHQLDKHKLIHMGGRVYDPRIGRFMSADLLVQSPYSSQSFNRYSYVANNPLSNIDPTGYQCEKITTKGTYNDGQGHSTDLGTSVRYEGECGGDSSSIGFWSQLQDHANSFVDHLQQNGSNYQSNYMPSITTSFGVPIDTSMDVTQYDSQVLVDAMTPGVVDAFGCAFLKNCSVQENVGAIAAVFPPLKIVKIATKEVGTLGKVANVSNSAGKLCFVAGTIVHTRDGLKPIEDIQVGDLVASKDEFTKEITWKPVVDLLRNHNKRILNITLSNSKGDQDLIGVTEEHPFWVEGVGWVIAGELQEGHKVSSIDGTYLIVKSIVLDAQLHDTYNFEVEDYHTYFVGELGAWVHNTCKQLFSSIKDSPNYPKTFKALQNGTSINVVKNKELLESLRKQEPGKWVKVYKDGFDAEGNKISIHYFRSESGKVFDVKTKNYWSND